MFIFYIILALLLTRVPVIGKYFQIFNTLIHEIGHAVAGIITFGKVNYMTLSMDAAGGASVSSRNWLTSILVTLAGYPFASGISFLMIVMIHNEQYVYILYSMIVLCVFCLILWIRNLFGFIWLMTAGVLTAAVLLYGDAAIITAYATTLVAVVFVDSFVSTLVLMEVVFKDRQNGGDAHNLRNKTGITEYFWALLFIAIACIPVYYSFDLWF